MSNRRKISRRLPTSFISRPPDDPATYWNYEPTPAVRVRVIVADAPETPLYWARDLVGTERDAVRVTYGGQVFYLDNADGSGWRKVTEGHGSPGRGHSSLWVERELVVTGEGDRG